MPVKPLMNPFDAFKGLAPHKAKIEALDGYEITFRKLTRAEADKFNKDIVKEYGDDGKPVIDMDAISEIVYEKISLCLIDPVMTIPQLKRLEADSDAAMAEIIKLLEKQPEKVDDEGNQKD